MSLLTYLDPNAIKDASIEGIKIKDGAISSSKIDETVASKSYVDALEARATNAVQITYADLKSLRDAGKLVPGTQYRITDYTCTTIQENTKSAGHQFDIIVTADDEGTLNEEARAILHTGDTYFANSNLSAWKLWYCIDNDINRFAWAAFGELIGTIKPTTGSASGTYTYNSPISEIIFNDVVYTLEIGVRTVISNGPPVSITKTDDYTLVLEDDFNYTKTNGISVYTVSQKGKGVIYRMIDEFNNDIPYDFKNIQFKHPNDTTTYPYYYYTFASGNEEDNTDNSLSISDYCYSNTIREDISNKKRKLNSIIFIGYSCYRNTFGEGCSDNSFEQNCNSNSFGNGCYRNTFGMNYYDNTFGSECWGNSFGSECWHNSFGNDCILNSFGRGCENNSFDQDCENNSFGNNCRNNSFGQGCENNSFGDNCCNNSFGNVCRYVKFVSYKSAYNKYRYYQYNHFGDGCQYILFTGEETESLSEQVQNYNFAQGLQGTDGAYLNIDGKRNLAYETKVAKNSNGEIKIYCEADLIL